MRATSSWLVVLAVFAGCTGSAYDVDQSKDLPLNDSGTTTSSQEESGASTEDEPAAQQSGNDIDGQSSLSIDVGEKGVDVEVGEAVDVEVDSQNGVRVDVGSDNEDADDQEPENEE